MMPFGQIDQRVDLIVRKMGFQPVSWNIDSNDYATTSSDCTAIPNAYKDQFSRLPAGWGKFIALQHDIVRCSLSTIDQVYNMIAAFNYTAVPMDTCLGDSTAYLDCELWMGVFFLGVC